MATSVTFQEQINIARESVTTAFERLFSLAEQRKLFLLAYLSKIEEEFNSSDQELEEKLNQLNDCNEAIENIIRINALRDVKDVFGQSLKDRRDIILTNRRNHSIYFKMDECVYQMVDKAGEFASQNLPTLEPVGFNSDTLSLNAQTVPLPFDDGAVTPGDSSLSQMEPIVMPFEITLEPRDYSKIENPSLSCGHKGTGLGEFHNPEGLAIDPNTSRLYIADCYNHRIQVFNPAGEFLFDFPPPEHRNSGHPHFLTYPGGICIHNSKTYITQHPFNLPQGLIVYTVEGVFCAGINLDGSDDGRIKSADVRGIAVGFDNNVYICDYSNDRLLILTQELAYFNEFLTVSGPIDVKARPSYLAVLGDGDQCISILSYNGEVLNRIISRGEDDEGGDVINSSFFDIDPFDNFVLSDRGNQCFYIYNLDGEMVNCVYLCTDSHSEDEVEEVFEPTGVAFSPNLSIVCLSCFRSEKMLQIF